MKDIFSNTWLIIEAIKPEITPFESNSTLSSIGLRKIYEWMFFRLHFLGGYKDICRPRYRTKCTKSCAAFKSTLPNQKSHVTNAPFRNNYEAQRRVGVRHLCMCKKYSFVYLVLCLYVICVCRYLYLLIVVHQKYL